MSAENGGVNLPQKKTIRFSSEDQKIITKVREAFSLSSDGEAVRFVLNFWWKTLGSDAVDLKKLASILAEEDEEKTEA
jgi:sulfur relay (sulfurtransferase) DsrC/TusE family protein